MYGYDMQVTLFISQWLQRKNQLQGKLLKPQRKTSTARGI